MKNYKYIGSNDPLVELINPVTLKVKKSDGTNLIIENIYKNETIISVEDLLSIKYLDSDPKYVEV